MRLVGKLVPHALELRHAGHDLEDQMWNRGLGRTLCRWLHELGWLWERAKLVARDDDPRRVERLTCIRFVFEHRKPDEAVVFADELDIHLLPKVGATWMPKGTQLAVMTRGRMRSTT